MSRQIDLNDPDSWSDEDVQYLAARDLLPKNLADRLQFDPDARKAVTGDIASPGDLSDRAHTGTVNSAGLSKEEFDRAVELLRMEQNGDLTVDDEEDEEDYEEGWNNDARRAELSKRGLSIEGTKDELIARLIRSDNDETTEEDQA